MVQGLKSVLVAVFFYGSVLNSLVSSATSCNEAQWKSPIKSSANCAIIHPLYPAGYQIPSGVIDQNKTQTQTNTHTEYCPTNPLCSLCACVCAAWGMWLHSRSELTVLIADRAPSCEATGKGRGQTPLQYSDQVFTTAAGNKKYICNNLTSLCFSLAVNLTR